MVKVDERRLRGPYELNGEVQRNGNNVLETKERSAHLSWCQ